MKQLSRRFRLSVVGVGVLMVSSAASAATIAVKATRVNGVALPSPTSTVAVNPGDVVEAEFVTWGWGTEIETVKTYQAEIDVSGLFNNTENNCGSIPPLHYDEPALRGTGFFLNVTSLQHGVCSEGSTNAGASCVLNTVPCTGGVCVDGLCDGGTNAGQLCATVSNQCVGGTCVTDPDFVMVDFANAICAVSTEPYKVGCTLFLDAGPTDPSSCAGGSTPGAPCESDADCAGGGTCNIIDSYIGSIVLKVADDALGSFALTVKTAPLSFISDANFQDAGLNMVPLNLNLPVPCDVSPRGGCCVATGSCQDDTTQVECGNLGGIWAGEGILCGAGFCECPTIVSSLPANCAVDARYPHPPDVIPPGSPEEQIGFRSADVTLSPGTEMSLLTPADFAFSFVGGGVFAPPTVTAVTPLGGTTVRLDFSKVLPIVPAGLQQGTRWSCLALACAGAGAKDVCWTHLPGDVDGGCTASAPDILTLIDDLNGILDPPLEYYQCDVDNSGACGAPDVLAVIDLLNGAGEFSAWNNFSCNGGACPTAP